MKSGSSSAKVPSQPRSNKPSKYKETIVVVTMIIVRAVIIVAIELTVVLLPATRQKVLPQPRPGGRGGPEVGTRTN